MKTDLGLRPEKTDLGLRSEKTGLELRSQKKVSGLGLDSQIL